MAVEVVMPRLGWTMEEGSIVEWLKRDGDTVQAGEILFTIESDKAVNEVEALGSGILHIPPDSPPPGTAVPIGTVLAYLLQPSETPASQDLSGDGPAPRAGSTAMPTATPKPSAVRTTTRSTALPAAEHGLPAISPRARRVAAELGVDWMALTGSGRTGRIVERDVRAAAEAVTAQPPQAPAARVSPLARRVATDAGIDIAALAQARPGERIRSNDVRQAAQPVVPAIPQPLPPALQSPVPSPQPPASLTSIRRLTAARLSESARTTVPVTLTTEADATRLVRLREEMTADLAGADRPVPTYTDLLVRLTAVALTEHPALNASLAGDAIVEHDAVHVGIAVDTDRGLLVPVVRDAHARSLLAISADTARLIAAARAGTIARDDLDGGTFTITNLGMYEIDAFAPVINLPECAILGVGRIVARQVVVDEATETVGIRKLMVLSLTFDHRVVDGAPAARFLQRIKHLIERPTLWLTQ